MAEFTKGKRQLYYADEYWFVETRDNNRLPNKVIGKFYTKEDALLDTKAPEMYQKLIDILFESVRGHEHFTDSQQARRLHISVSTLREVKQLLAEVEGK